MIARRLSALGALALVLALALGTGACTRVAGSGDGEPAASGGPDVIEEVGSIRLTDGSSATVIKVYREDGSGPGWLGYSRCVVINNGYVRPDIAISCIP